MKQAVRILCLLLCLVILSGCTPNTTAPDSSGAALDGAVKTQQAIADISALGSSPDDNYRTWYEIFVYSFCDSNGDGIGDLQGVLSKLDYLQELGINGIWLMPIHPSTSYHKYNVSDYYAIDPAYGTMADFESLMTECGKRDIHVILDLVVNHTGSDHPWFQEAYQYLQQLPAGTVPSSADCKYLDYYFFKTKEEARGTYSEVTGTNYMYESCFSYDMPDLNLDNQSLRQDIAAIMKFWQDKGVNGFRLDAAKEFFSGRTSKNVEVLSWLTQAAKANDPDSYLVAEVWDTFANITEYYASGIDSIFNYPFGDVSGKITKVLRGAGQESMVTTYATYLEKVDKAYLEQNPNYIDAPFLSNHDVGRIAGFAARDEGKVKLAAAMNLFMGGSAFIYYGEEIGMTGSGNDPSKRAPMYWNDARDQGTTNPPPECTVPDSYPFASLEKQRADDASIYNYYRQVIAIRKALPVISHGRVTAETELNVGCISAQRKTWGEEACIILMNVAPDGAQADLSAYSDWKLVASLAAGEEAISLEGSTLTLPAYGVAVLQKG